MSKYTRCRSYAYSNHAPFLSLPPPPPPPSRLYFLAQPLRDTPIFTPISCSSNSQPVHLQKKTKKTPPKTPKQGSLGWLAPSTLPLPSRLSAPLPHHFLLLSLPSFCHTFHMQDAAKSKFSPPCTLQAAWCFCHACTRFLWHVPGAAINSPLLQISTVPSSVTLCGEL